MNDSKLPSQEIAEREQRELEEDFLGLLALVKLRGMRNPGLADWVRRVDARAHAQRNNLGIKAAIDYLRSVFGPSLQGRGRDV
jgi:hypothetical protein